MMEEFKEELAHRYRYLGILSYHQFGYISLVVVAVGRAQTYHMQPTSACKWHHVTDIAEAQLSSHRCAARLHNGLGAAHVIFQL